MKWGPLEFYRHVLLLQLFNENFFLKKDISKIKFKNFKLPNHPSITDCQTIQQIHENNHNEKNKAQKIDITKSSINGKITKFQFSNKHSECFDNTITQSIEKEIIFIWIYIVVLVQQNVESKPKSKNEKGVPGQK